MSRVGIEPIVHTVSRICEPRLSETGSEMDKHCPSFFIGVWRRVPASFAFQEVASTLWGVMLRGVMDHTHGNTYLSSSLHCSSRQLCVRSYVI